MATINFCWREYLERDVSLFEEVETAAPNILMKYVYPDSLLHGLLPKFQALCFAFTSTIKHHHGGLYCEEELCDLYHKGTKRAIVRDRMLEFIKRSLLRLLLTEEKPWHPLFTGGMVPRMAELFCQIVFTPPDETISIVFKNLWRPVGKQWGNLPDHLMSEVRDSQAKFLFLYIMSYLRKFVTYASDGSRLPKLTLRRMELIVSSFSQENAKDLMYQYVTIPTRTHFDIDNKSCLIRKCSFMKPHQLARYIIGPRVFNSLKKESQEWLEEVVHGFIEKHRKLCARLALLEWLSPDKKLLSSVQLLLSKIDGLFYSSIRCLYTRFNLEAAGRELIKCLHIKYMVVNEELFTSISVGFNPEPVPFIDSLSQYLGRRGQTLASEFQQAVFYNSMFFYYFYTIHWIRRVAHFTPSVFKGTRGYQLWWRDEAEVKKLLDQANAWAVKGSKGGPDEDLDTTGCQEAEDEPTDWQDGEAPSTSRIEEPEIYFPRVGTSTKRAKEDSSGAEKGGEEAESPGRKSTLKEKKKRKKDCDEEVAESQESGEKVKKKKKRKRNPSDHEEMEVVEPSEVSADSKEDPTTPRAKRFSEPIEVVTLSSDDEAELSLHQWEAKWMAQLNRLSADPSVPSMACLTLQTVFENSKRIRLELKNLEG